MIPVLISVIVCIGTIGKIIIFASGEEDYLESPLKGVNVSCKNKDLLSVIEKINALSNFSMKGLSISIETIPTAPDENGTIFSVDLEEPTLRKLLDTLINKDNHYLWKLEKGIIIIAPRDKALENNPDYLLNKMIDFFSVKKVNPDEVVDKIYGITHHKDLIAEVRMGAVIKLKKIDLNLSNVTVREILNELSRKKVIKGWEAYNWIDKKGRLRTHIGLFYY